MNIYQTPVVDISTLLSCIKKYEDYQSVPDSKNLKGDRFPFLLFETILKNPNEVSVDYSTFLSTGDETFNRYLHKYLPKLKNKPFEDVIKHFPTTSTPSNFTQVVLQNLLNLIYLELKKKEKTPEYIFSLKATPEEGLEPISDYIDSLLDLLSNIGDDVELTTTLNKIDKIFKYMYKSLYTTGIGGVLTDKGFLYTNNEGDVYCANSQSYITLYSLFDSGNKIKHIMDKSGDGFSTDDTYLGFNINDYKPDFDHLLEGSNLSLPLFHLACTKRVISGNVFNLEKDFYSTLRKFFKVGLSKLKKKEGSKGLDLFRDNITRVLLMIESDADVQSIKGCFGKINSTTLNKAYEDNKDKLFSGMGNSPALTFNKEIETFSVKLIVDNESFINKPTFAYQIALANKEQGIFPTLSNLPIGRDISGDPVSISLAGNDHQTVSIVAGKRSGKGITTMNLIGSLLAAGSPVIYIDGKPDIGEVLFNLSKQLGVKPTAWDTMKPFNVDYKLTNVSGENYINELRSFQSVVGPHLTALKLLQLLIFDSRNNTPYTSNNPVFVFDELNVNNDSFGELIKEATRVLKSLSKSVDNHYYRFCDNLITWATSLTSLYGTALKASIPKSGIKVITLYQDAQVNAFKKSLDKLVTSVPYSSIASDTTPLRLLGRGTFNSSEGLGDLKDGKDFSYEKGLIENAYHFGLTKAQKVTKSDVSVIKPYFVLKEFGGDDEYNFKENVTSRGGKLDDALLPSGEFHPGVSFAGYLDIITQGNLKSCLQNSRDYIEGVFARTVLSKKYTDLDDYLYDCGIDSLVSIEQLEGKVSLPNNLPVDESGEEYIDLSSGSDSGVNSFFSSTAFKNDVSPENRTQKSPLVSPLNNNPQNNQKTAFTNNTPLKDNAPPLKTIPFEQEYTEHLEIPLALNPFDEVKVKFFKNDFTKKLIGYDQMSLIIYEDILKMFKRKEKVVRLRVCSDKTLVINDIAYRPTLSEDIIESIPFDEKERVKVGCVGGIINFRVFKKFKYLTYLSLDNFDASSAFKAELGIQDLDKVFTIFPRLEEINFAGVVVNRGSYKSSQAFREVDRKLKTYKEKAYNHYNNKGYYGTTKGTSIKKLYQQPIVKTATKVFGYTAGSAIVFTAISAVGGLPFLLAGLTMTSYDMYKGKKKPPLKSSRKPRRNMF
jgi:hypothetical protein